MASLRSVIKILVPTRLFRLIEPVGHLMEAILANIWYGFPSRKMHVIGITGTNGKTTTTFMVNKMLHNALFKVGMLSTVAYGIGNDLKPQVEHITTAQSGILQKRLRDFKRAGVKWVVIETSSHSLAQHRIWGIPYEIAAMTNVTNDHLDYHGTFENYLEAKRSLFTLASRNGLKLGIVNSDDPNAQKFIESTPRSLTYGIKAGQLQAKNIQLFADYSTYEVDGGDEKYNITVNIPGEFNISNSLIAVAIGRELGLTKGQIERGIAATTSVEGRMSTVNEGQKFKVIIDFASTPDAFTRLFENVRPTTKGKLIAVFGSAGRRDEAKRAVQGEIAAKYSDEVILTEEDDRDVDGVQILEQIADGAKKAGKVIEENLFLISDREKAIRFALERASSPDDTVVLLGKGHEKTIERADGAHPWNETEVTSSALKAMLKSANK
jgi:UDP-N-acetylmuramoyl-L-alanyl-D-glutamate--2,6-diaminopimelate ligase